MALLARPTTPQRVAMHAPISWRVPRPHYGPREQYVSLLTEGLIDRGVDVTLFATADSLTGGRLDPSHGPDRNDRGEDSPGGSLGDGKALDGSRDPLRP